MITDEMIEVAARAKYEEDREILKPALGRKPCEWEELRDIERKVHMREARAALSSVLPMLMQPDPLRSDCYCDGIVRCAVHIAHEGHIAGLKEAAEIAWQLHCGERKDSAYAVHCEILARISTLENPPNPLTNQVNPPTEE